MTLARTRTRLVENRDQAEGALVIAVGASADLPAELEAATGVDPQRLSELAKVAAGGYAVAPARSESGVEYLVFVLEPEWPRDECLAELRLRALRAVASLPASVTTATVERAGTQWGDLAAFEMLCEGVLGGAFRQQVEGDFELIGVGGASLLPVLRRVATIGAATAWVRAMVEVPSSEMRPAGFTERAFAATADSALELSAWSPDRLLAERMSGLLAVARGSAPPTMIDVSYGVDEQLPLLVLVGKAVTFDSGGLQAKQTRMEWNKADMAGGAAVLATAWAIADLQLPLRLRVLVPCAENLGGPDAYRPGDVIRHRDGRTSEVRFTDGEGRLILADVLAYASALEAAAVVDVATLTSPYGPRMWGYASNDESLASELAAASAEAGEPAFRVPLHHAYLDELESPIADLANYVTVPGAANDHSALKAITAALFLESFVDDRAWAHIDIAGTAFNLLPGAGLPAGATGCTVATLVRLAMRYAGAKLPR